MGLHRAVPVQSIPYVWIYDIAMETITLIYLYDYRVNNKSYSDSVISVSYYPNMFVSTFPHYSQ